MNERSWILPEDAELFDEVLNKLIGIGCIVELGTFRGGTTEMFAGKCKTSLWTIDKYVINAEFMTVYDDYNPVVLYKRYFQDRYNNVFFIVGDSLYVGTFWTNPIELCLLDADHGRDITKQNFTVWDRNIVKGGYAIFHDFNMLNNLIPEILSEYINYEFYGSKGITSIIRKKL